MPLPPLRSDTVRAERDPGLSDEAAQVLDRAAHLIGFGWSQLAEARDVRNRRVMATDPKAVAWCVTGARAVRIICGPATTSRVCAVHSYVFAIMRHVTEWHDLQRWNDRLHERSRAEVVTALRAGAAKVRADRAARGFA